MKIQPYFLIACLFSVAAQAQTVVYQQDFENLGVQEGKTYKPEELKQLQWTAKSTGEPVDSDKVADWFGWRLSTKKTWGAKLGNGSDRGESTFTRGNNVIALVESDAIREKNGKRFQHSLSSAAITADAGKYYQLEFDNFYKEGSTFAEYGEVVAKYDNGQEEVLTKYEESRLNQHESLVFKIPQSVGKVNFEWRYQNTENNWFWAIDNIKVTADVPAPQVPQEPQEPKLIYGPVLENPTPKSMTVMIRTREQSPRIRYRKKGTQEAFIELPAEHAGTVAGIDFSDPEVYFVTADKLSPNTLYEYQIVTMQNGQDLVSKNFYFKTWPLESSGVKETSFLVISDSQGDRENRFTDLVKEGMVKFDCNGQEPADCADKISGILIAGDLVDSTGTHARDWNSFFSAMQPISPYVPLIPAIGNHEYTAGEHRTQSDVSKVGITYRKYFYGIPRTGDDGVDVFLWYATDFLDMKILVTDSTAGAAMHNTYNWNTQRFNFGRDLVNYDAMQKQETWVRQQLEDAKQKGQNKIIEMAHMPCLSTKWRQGEVVFACDFISLVEKYGLENDALTASIAAHVHAYERGNSMDARHLWLNPATASGGREGEKQGDETDLDVFSNTATENDNAYGYGVLKVGFEKNNPQMHWLRRNLTDIRKGQDKVFDEFFVSKKDRSQQKPTLTTPIFKNVAPQDEQLNLAYQDGALASPYEAQWQLTLNPNLFDTYGKNANNRVVMGIFDIWGNDTRSYNWTYINGQRVDTQQGADVHQLALNRILSQPKRLYPNVTDDAKRQALLREVVPGGNDFIERWRCERKWDDLDDDKIDNDEITERKGGRQCFARLSYDGKKKSPLDPFNGMAKVPTLKGLLHNQVWYYRVRTRDENLNWSAWSEPGQIRVLDDPSKIYEEDISAFTTRANAPGLKISAKITGTCTFKVTAKEPLSAEEQAQAGENMLAPHGAIHYALENCGEGEDAQIALKMPKDFSLKSLKNGQMQDLGLNLRIEPIDNDTSEFSYTVIDGSLLDNDDATNGSIQGIIVPLQKQADNSTGGNPTGPQSNVGIQNIPATSPLSLLLGGLGLGLAALRRKKKNRPAR